MRITIVFVIIVLASCSPYKFRTQHFTAGDAENISVVVPKGFNKVEEGLDTAGNFVRTYHYGGNMKFFIEKVNREIEWIDTTFHIPRIHPNGAVMYKYMEDGPVYTREIRLKDYRFGYIKVPRSLEIRFDSAVNHIRDRSF